MNTRACSACGAPVMTGDYCSVCGSPLADDVGVRCLACGQSNPRWAKFCLGCGTPQSSVSEAERRVITVLFADLSGFTGLTEQLDPETVRNFIAGCVDRLCECVTRWGGFVDKFIGDCVMALFGAPVAYENEPERALRAALEMHAAVEDMKAPAGGLDYRPRLRIGVNTGPVVTGVFSGGGTVDYTAVGDTVNVASRLQGLCEPGETVVGGATYDQARHVFEFDDEKLVHVKGRREPVRVRRLMRLRAQRGRARGFEDRRTPLVGRAEQMAALRSAWERVRGGGTEVWLLAGPAGIGKSRLVEELANAAGLSAEDLATGRSYPYARSTPWEPIAELIRDVYDIAKDFPPAEAAERIAAGGDWSEEEVAALAVALGAPGSDAAALRPFGPAERQDLVRRAVARTLSTTGGRPRILLLEDLHWADQATLDFLQAIPELEGTRETLWVLVTRPPLPGEQQLARLVSSVQRRLELAPLSDSDARRLVDGLLGEHALPEAALTTILDRAGGNPLFLEETLKTLISSGAIQLEDGVWRAREDLTQVEIPDTIESVLSTRIDGLDPGARRVLQYAAVVGRRFWSGVLSDALVRHPVERELDDLSRGAFVRPLSFSMIDRDREFMFEHLLLQEVAYESMLRGTRTELHGAVAEWLETHLGAQTPEADEWIAFHYERSDHADRALPFLERAAAAARERGALSDAIALLGRALDVTQEADPTFRLLCRMDDLLAAAGDTERREEILARLAETVEESSNPDAPVELAYRRARLLLDRGDLAGARSAAQAALEDYGALERISRQDDLVSLSGRVAHLWGDYPHARSDYEASLPLHRSSGDRQGEAETLDRLGLLEVDVGDFTLALRHLDSALELARELENRPFEARVNAHRATALRWLGRYEDARAAAVQALVVAQACGSRRAEAAAELTLGAVLGAVGRADEALQRIERACELAGALGRSRLAARAWLERAEVEEGSAARRSAVRACELADAAGLVHVEILARTREAALALEADDLEAADQASEAAVEGLRRHGNIQGPEEAVLYTRARVLSALGRRKEAGAALEEARSLVREKAEHIESPADRQTFLEAVPLNRVILSDEGVPHDP